MPKVTINDGQGLVQETGSGLSVNSNASLNKITTNTGVYKTSTGTLAYGVYEAAFEIDLEGSTPTADADGLLKTVATLPANCNPISARIICSETFAPNQALALDLGVCSDTITAANQILSGDLVNIIVAANLDPDSAGTAGDFSMSVFSGTTATSAVALSGAGTKLVLYNNTTSNGTTIMTAGKVVIIIKICRFCSSCSSKHYLVLLTRY